MKPRRVIRYSDPLRDDFTRTTGRVRPRLIDESYPYEHRSPLWRALSFLLYRLLATPLGYLFCRLRFGIRFRNRRVLRRLPGGFFLYGNHTQAAADAFIPTLLSFPRRCHVIVGPEAVSLPVVGRLVPLLGGLPLAATLGGKRHFCAALERRARAGDAIAVYPEAHIWEYYNGIRPYGDVSFSYPARLGLPAVGFTVTYRQRRLLRGARPLITVTVSEPVWPEGEPPRAARHRMRESIYAFMRDTAARENSFAWYRYEYCPGVSGGAPPGTD